MSFTDRITRHPIPFAPDLGAEALAHLHHLSPDMRLLVEGAAGCSPYLAGLMAKEGHWLSHALEDEPEDRLTEIISDVAALLPGELNSGLRKLKRRAALLVALADLGGVWGVHTVTQPP